MKREIDVIIQVTREEGEIIEKAIDLLEKMSSCFDGYNLKQEAYTPDTLNLGEKITEAADILTEIWDNNNFLVE